MAEPATIDTPAPAATPAPEVKTEIKGIDAHMADFDKAVTPKAKPSEPAPKADPPKDAPKPGEKKTDAPPAKPDDGQPSWDKAPPRLRKAYEDRTKELEQFKKTSQQQIADYESKVKALESKRVESPGDAKRIEEYQGRITKLEQELAQSAYERSTEFKTKYVDRWSDAYKTAVEEVKQLVVGEGDGDERKERAATEADFRRILALPLKDQGVAARRMFGDAADAVLAHRNFLTQIRREGEQALEQAKLTSETKAKEKEESEKKERETFDTTREAALGELRTKYAPFFGEDPADEEGTAALKGGYEFVDNAVNNSGKMTLEQKAVYAALVHARAAAFPREVLKVKRLTAEVTSLKEELAKFRKSDPGADGGGGGGGAPSEPKDVTGIEAMAAKFNKTA